MVDLLALADSGTDSQQCSNCEENNSATHYCFECQSFLCTTCFEAHQRIKATRGHKNIFVKNLQASDVDKLIRRPAMCSEKYHQDQPLEYYCQDCNVCTCIKCSVVSHNHHTMVDMQKAADEQKMQIDEALKKVKAEVVILENEMKDQTELMNKNKTQISAAREKMNETVDDCIRLLTEHKASMNAKFDEINQAHQKAHATHLENFQLAVTRLKSSLEQGENILERNINAEILQTKPVIIGRCEDLSESRKTCDLRTTPCKLRYRTENGCCGSSCGEPNRSLFVKCRRTFEGSERTDRYKFCCFHERFIWKTVL